VCQVSVKAEAEAKPMAKQGRSKDRSRATTKLHPGHNQAKPRHKRRLKNNDSALTFQWTLNSRSRNLPGRR
jgi:hypothetical protein